MVKTRGSTIRTTATVAVAELEPEAGPSRPRKRVKVEERVQVKEAVDEVQPQDNLADKRPSSKKARRKTVKVEKIAVSVEETDTQNILLDVELPKKSKGKVKAPPYDPSTFIPRMKSPWKIGAHVSASGGVENAVVNAAMIGANAFALFLKSQRKWISPPLGEESAKLFKERMKELDYDPKYVLPHGSYLVNLGHPDREKRMKSYDCFLDDLERCEALGLMYYNFHPGSSVGEATREESIRLIGECLNSAHKATSSVVTVLENMAGAGNVIGSTFEDIAGIIAHVEDKTRVGVCFDTCHAYAAGYDISTKEGWESTMTEFDEIIGVKYLCGMHMNDSKTPKGSKRDRHESIGLGTLGLPAFQNIVNDSRTRDIPLILETPSFDKPFEVWGTEIKVLNSLSGDSSLGLGTSESEPSHVANGPASLSNGVGSASSQSNSNSQITVERSLSPLTEPEDDDKNPDDPLRKSMDVMLEDIRSVVAKASRAAEEKKAKSKVRSAKRKRGHKRGGDGEEAQDEDDMEDEFEDGV